MTATATTMPRNGPETARDAAKPAKRGHPPPPPPEIGQIVRYTVAGTGVVLPAVVVAVAGDRIAAQVFKQSGDGTYLITEVPRGRPAEPRTWHPADGG